MFILVPKFEILKTYPKILSQTNGFCRKSHCEIDF